MIHNPKVTLEPHCFLSAWCMNQGGGSSCVQNIRHHSTTFSCQGDRGPGISASYNTHLEVVCCNTYVFQQTFQIHKLTITHWPLQNHSFMNIAN